MSRHQAEGEKIPAAGEQELRDEELTACVGRARKGDQTAFARILEMTSHKLKRRLHSLQLSTHDVEDVLQITYLQAFRSLGRFDPRRSFDAWLHGIAFNCARTFLRSKRRRWWQIGTPPDRLDAAGGRTASNPEQQAAGRQLGEIASAAFAQLNPDVRLAFALHEIEGLCLREVSELLGASTTTVWSRVRKAQKILQQHLEQATRSSGSPSEPEP